MKLKNKAGLLAGLMVYATLTFAGTEGGGGGDAVILPTGDVVLADVFLDRNQPQPDNMPRRISMNPKLLLQVGIYKDFLRMQMKRTQVIDKSGEVEDLMDKVSKRESDIVFYAVKDQNELNTYCASGGNKAYVLPDGAKVTQVACTSGNEIFLVEPLFKKMNILQQALLLAHERMTTLRDEYGGKNYGAIAGVTSGLGKLLEIAYEQQHGTYRKLTEAEMKRIRLFYEGLIELEYRNKEIPRNALSWNIHSNGGGVVHNGSSIDPSSVLSVSSSLMGAVQVGSNSSITETTIEGEVEIGTQAIISDSKIKLGTGTTIGNNVVIQKSNIDAKANSSIGNDVIIATSLINSQIIFADNVELKKVSLGSNLSSANKADIGANSKLIGSTLTNVHLAIGSNLLIKNSSIVGTKLSAGDNMTIVDSSINLDEGTYYRSVMGTLKLNGNQTMKNGALSSNSVSNYIPEGFELKYPRIAIPQMLTKCQDKMSTYKKAVSDCSFRDNDCVYSYYSAYNKFTEPTVAAGNATLKYSQKIESTSMKPLFGHTTYLYALRSFSMELALTPMPVVQNEDAKTIFSVYKGVLAPAKANRVYQIKATELVGSAIADELQKAGASATHYNGTVAIKLPVIE